MRLTEVRVYQDGEELGRFYRTRARNGDDGVFVTNKRIRSKRERGGGLSTKDTKKAIAEIKKNFGATTVAERVEEANNLAMGVMQNAVRDKSSESYRASRDMQTHKTAFLESAEGQRLFWEYVDSKAPPAEANTIHRDRELQVRLDKEHKELEGMRTEFTNSEAMLVLRTDGGYITQLAGETKTETDSTLPENIRMKLGMLKLIQNEEAVPTAGFRVDDSTFVISMGDKDD